MEPGTNDTLDNVTLVQASTTKVHTEYLVQAVYKGELYQMRTLEVSKIDSTIKRIFSSQLIKTSKVTDFGRLQHPEWTK